MTLQHVLDARFPSPVHDLRPARDTCEQCHWPEKFTGDVVKTIPELRRRRGQHRERRRRCSCTSAAAAGAGAGRTASTGTPRADHEVEYIATDDKRQEIPWVRLTDADGQGRRVRDGRGRPGEADQGASVRTMDCVDCHNRPSHRFAPTAERAVDAALWNQALPQTLPFVRREAVAALKETYADRATARARDQGAAREVLRRDLPGRSTRRPADRAGRRRRRSASTRTTSFPR